MPVRYSVFWDPATRELEYRRSATNAFTRITLPITGGGGISDGDKGDISVTGGGTTWTIDNDAVTYAKLQNISATQRVLARNAAGAGDAEETTITQILDWIGSTRGSLLYRGVSGWSALVPGTSTHVLTSNGAGADPSWQAAGGVSDGDKGDITVSGGGTVWTIDASAVTSAKFRDSVGLSVVGRSANTTGVVADISAGVDGDVLRRSGTTLGFGTIPQASVISLVSDLAAKVPTTRTISTTAPLAGGGDLSANLTLTVAAATTAAVGVVELATDGENAANVVVQGNDSRLSNARTPTAHATSHQDGGSDEISVTGLSGLLADAQKVTIRKNTGADVGTRQRINFIEGTNVTLTVTDDAGSNEVDVTIASSGGGGGGGGTTGTTEVDFGAFPGALDASVVVTGQASIVSGSIVQAWLRCVDTTDHSADEHWAEAGNIRIEVSDIVAATGFTIRAVFHGGAEPSYHPHDGYSRFMASATTISVRQCKPGMIINPGGKSHRTYGKYAIQWRWS